MKITNELRDRINREVAAKHEDEHQKLRNNADTCRKKALAELQAEVEVVRKEHPALAELLAPHRINLTAVAYGNKCPANKEIGELDNKIKTEVENIIITISYGKTIEDVKAAFTTYGLSF